MEQKYADRIAAAVRALEVTLLEAWRCRPANAQVKIYTWDLDGQAAPWSLRVDEIGCTTDRHMTTFSQSSIAAGLGVCALAERAILMRAFSNVPELGYTQAGLRALEKELIDVIMRQLPGEVSLTLSALPVLPNVDLPHSSVRVRLMPHELDRISEMAKLASHNGVNSLVLSNPARLVPLDAEDGEFDEKGPVLDRITLNVSAEECYWSGNIRGGDALSRWQTNDVALASLVGAGGALDLRD